MNYIKNCNLCHIFIAKDFFIFSRFNKKEYSLIHTEISAYLNPQRLNEEQCFIRLSDLSAYKLYFLQHNSKNFSLILLVNRKKS